ncbi:MAG: metalloregulator ArsR/SmtB family transcription factor [Spirochaetales bacterium]|nr:metalloregulator ArsR/SmtB family transcription factor [Spirochaetales bacterium]
MTCLPAFKALGEQTRLRLLNLLLHHELNVQELTEILQMGQPRVSRHLKVLADSGFLDSRRDGLWAFYRVRGQGESRRLLDAIAYLFQGEEPFQEDLRCARGLLQEGRQATRRFFDAVAADWENLRSDILGQLDLAAAIAARLPHCPVVSDLGCGSGALLGPLTRRADTVIGIDASERMLFEARRRLERQSLGGVQLRLGELEHLPMGDAETNWAVVNLVLHHLQDPRAGLREAARVVQPGGGLIVVDFDKHAEELLRSRYGDRWLGFTDQEMTGWMVEVGFRVEQRHKLPVRLGLTALLWRAVRTQMQDEQTAHKE